METVSVDRRGHPLWLRIETWTAPDGWQLRRFRAEPDDGAGKRGALLFQTGRADFFEKYIEAIDHWRTRGWSVEGFDWRGQGGSGRVLPNPRIGQSPGYAAMGGDLDAYIRDWAARRPGPRIAIGHSMGGHLILRGLAERRVSQIDGAVLVAPMLGLNSGFLPEAAGRAVAQMACRLGLGARPAWSESAGSSGHRQRNLTHSAERYADEQWWRKTDSQLDVGPPTWQWLADSWDSIATLKTPGLLEAITLPIAILSADHDRLVRSPAIRQAAARLPHAQLLESKDSAHEILREIDPIRLWAMGEIDTFLDGIGQTA